MNNFDWESFGRNAQRFFLAYMPFWIILGVLLLVGTFLGPLIGVLVVLGSIALIVLLILDFINRGW